MSTAPPPSRLRAADVGRLGLSGLVSRPTRAVLSALGIAIGIAAMVAVVGISTSSQSRLAATLDELGTNLLSASPGKSIFAEDTELPLTAGAAAGRVRGVDAAATLGSLDDIGVYRSAAVETPNTNGIGVAAASLELLDVVAGKVSVGQWLSATTSSYPVVVLGADAAERLGITEPGRHVVIDDVDHLVAGILEPVELAPTMNSLALVGFKAGAALSGAPVPPTTVYVRADEERIDDVRKRLPATVKPQASEEVEVTRPSDALSAKQAADEAFTGLLVGLGSIALLVGGIGVANTMVISVLERRREIGLRRALGATRAHVRRQFLAEALLLSGLGGAAGILIGIAVTAVFTASKGWPLAVPPGILGAAFGATIVIGAVAGLYPAMRAARIPPTEALRS
jgi:putative ABC transport system permease protein